MWNMTEEGKHGSHKRRICLDKQRTVIVVDSERIFAYLFNASFDVDYGGKNQMAVVSIGQCVPFRGRLETPEARLQGVFKEKS